MFWLEKVGAYMNPKDSTIHIVKLLSVFIKYFLGKSLMLKIKLFLNLLKFIFNNVDGKFPIL